MKNVLDAREIRAIIESEKGFLESLVLNARTLDKALLFREYVETGDSRPSSEASRTSLNSPSTPT